MGLLLHLQNLNELKFDYYKRPQIIMEFEQVIADHLNKQINDSDLLGIMLDETCDISIHEKLAIYIPNI